MTQLERKALETLYYVLRNFVIWADRVPNSRKDRRAYRLRAIDRWVGEKLNRPMVFISPKEDVKWGYVARPRRTKKHAKRPVRLTKP